jgi:hypothetical protein
MFRFRLRTLFIAFGIASVICCALVLISRIGGPVAVVVVSTDPNAVFTADNILKWSKSAMREAGLTPTVPAVWRKDLEGDERFIGRNTITPNDRAFIQWFVGGLDKPTYAVMVERSQTQITVSISRKY